MAEFDFGTTYEGVYKGRIYKKDTLFAYCVHVPDPGKDVGPFALCVNHDGINESEVRVMKRLAEDGKAPYCVFVGVTPGKLPSTNGGRARNMRLDDYDIFSADYPLFIVKELIPYLTEKYSLRISDSPDYHAVSGGSSGGISAFNMAWLCNDYFHRVYMSSPSFLSMVRGNELPILVRKTETKPIRIYMEYSENEPNDYFGSSYCAAMEIKMALEFAGYDFKCVEYRGEGHCSRYRKNNDETQYDGYAYLWKDYATVPVKVRKLSSRVSRVVRLSRGWEKASRFPAKPACKTEKGLYKVRKNKIVFIPADDPEKKEICILDGFSARPAIELSSDQWRLYVADPAKGCVYAYTLDDKGYPVSRYLHGSLHKNTDFSVPGGWDLCTDEADRLFVATEIGIQAVRSFGLIDCILTLPDGLPEKIAFGSRGTCLYVKTAQGIFKRKLLRGGRKAQPTLPMQNSYYD